MKKKLYFCLLFLILFIILVFALPIEREVVTVTNVSSIANNTIFGPSPSSYEIECNATYVYILTDTPTDNITMFDITGANPVYAGGFRHANLSGVKSMARNGNFLYVVTDSSQGLTVVNVSDPISISITSKITNSTCWSSSSLGPNSIFVDGNTAYTVDAGTNRICIVNISNVISPVIISNLLFTNGIRIPAGIFVSGNYAYVVNDTGFAISNVTILTSPNWVTGSLIINATNLGSSRGIWSDGNYAYVASGGYFNIINVSNPASTSIVGFIYNTTLLAGSRGINVSGNYAYVISYNSNAITVINTSNKTNPSIVGYYADGVGHPAYSDYPSPAGSFNNPFDIAVCNNKAYVPMNAIGGGSLWTENPAFPNDIGFMTFNFSTSFISYPIINGNKTVPSTMVFGDLPYIEVNLSEEGWNKITKVNFTVKAPNGSLLINDLNGTWISGNASNGENETWRSAVFNISNYTAFIGNWIWNYTIYNNISQNISANDTFFINDTNSPTMVLSSPISNSTYESTTDIFNISLDFNVTDNLINNTMVYNYSIQQDTEVSWNVTGGPGNPERVVDEDWTTYASGTGVIFYENFTRLYVSNITYNGSFSNVEDVSANAAVYCKNDTSWVLLNNSIANGFVSQKFNWSIALPNNCIGSNIVQIRTDWTASMRYYEGMLIYNNTNYSLSEQDLIKPTLSCTYNVWDVDGNSYTTTNTTVTINTTNGNGNTIFSTNARNPASLYYMYLLCNDTLNLQTSSNISFYVHKPATETGSTTGSGAGAGTSPFVCSDADVTWEAYSDVGTQYYSFYISPSGTRTKLLNIYNTGAGNITISLGCVNTNSTNNICDYLNLSENNFIVEPGLNKPKTIDLGVDLRESNLKFGDSLNGYLIITEKNTCNTSFSIDITINPLGYVLDPLALIKKMTRESYVLKLSKISNNIKDLLIPYAVINLLFIVVVFSLLRFVIFRKLNMRWVFSIILTIVFTWLFGVLN